MCGITGIFGKLDNKEEIITIMNGLISHRGPDDDGFYNDEHISLGHRRLSIIDLNTGKQPIFNEDKTICIVFNGEIYNFQEIKKDLEKKGHKFYTKTDTEVLVHLYEEKGENLLEDLNGIFAFAIWDYKNKKLMIARDPMGVKPLYYSIKDDNVYFASEIKAIVQSGLVDPEINEDSMHEFFFYRYIPNKKTIFKNVNKLMAGEYLIIDQNNIELKQFNYESEHNFEKNTEEEISTQLSKTIFQSTINQMISDVPVGAFLSGGIDSSIVTANAALHNQKKIETFSVQFDTNDSLIKSEIKYARVISDKFMINSHKLIVREREVLEKLPLIAWHYDEPMGDAATIPTFFVSEFAKRNVKVVLAGEGGDEQFAGYTKYEKLLLIKDEEIDKIVKKYIKDISVFLPEQMNELFKNFNQEDFEEKNVTFLKAQFESKKDMINSVLEFDQKTMLCENYLMKGDKMTMAHGLEERVPLLDKDVVNMSRKINSKYKIKDNQEKYILKKSAKHLLPEEIVDRKKQGYGTPTKCWFKNSIGEIFKSRVNNSEFIKKYCNLEYVNNLVEDHLNEKNNNNTKLWNLIAFDIWYEIYIKQKLVRPQESYSELLNIK